MDVWVLRWPDQTDEADRLASLGTPRLLLIESGVAPPPETGCLVDWQRLPADDRDVDARLRALTERAMRHSAAPIIDEYGGITYRGTTVFLSPVDERIAKFLIERLGHPVPADELISRAWTENGTNETLRVHISRLRHHLAPLALTITNIRGHGYVLREAETTGTTQHLPSQRRRALQAAENSAATIP
jgi:DNA-binding winged helix-turn-helix (wHTH) protein